MSSEKERTDKRIGWVVSVLTHLLIVLLFFLVNAWTAPDPPLPEYGIELNFGMEEAGSGNVQPSLEPSPPAVDEQGEPEEEIVEPEEELVEVSDPIEQEPESAVEDLPDSQQEDSPTEVQPTNTQEPAELQVEEPEEQSRTEVEAGEQPEEEEAVEEPPQVDTESLYPGAGSQGNADNETGDAGDPEGSLDSQALYGNQGGGGGGPSLDLAGWRWDQVPNPNDNSKENGRIVFEIKVDDNGEVIGVRTLEKTVSPAVERLYRQEVEKLSFSPTTDNTLPASISTGKITFIIQSK
jgi:protein TonB